MIAVIAVAMVAVAWWGATITAMGRVAGSVTTVALGADEGKGKSNQKQKDKENEKGSFFHEISPNAIENDEHLSIPTWSLHYDTLPLFDQLWGR